MLKSLARLQTTGEIYVGKVLGRPQVKRILPVDPRRSAIAKLVHLRRTGAALLSGIRDTPFGLGLGIWESKVSHWTEKVIEAIEPISKDDALWFETFDIVPLASVRIPNVRCRSREDRARFIAVFREHDCRLARLRHLLAKYGVHAAGGFNGQD
jgi:hypothetical protein